MRLVRHWQHHPISLAPVSKLRLERSDATAAGASSSGSNCRFVTPVVLSKVQHFLESSNAAAPSGIPSYTSPITAAEGHATGRSSCICCAASIPSFQFAFKYADLCAIAVEKVSAGLQLIAMLSTK